MVGHRVLKFKLILGGHDSRVTSSVDVITQEGGGQGLLKGILTWYHYVFQYMRVFFVIFVAFQGLKEFTMINQCSYMIN